MHGVMVLRKNWILRVQTAMHGGDDDDDDDDDGDDDDGDDDIMLNMRIMTWIFMLLGSYARDESCVRP